MKAEWEYACRAGSVSAYCFGDAVSRLHEYAWYNANSEGQIHAVGQLKPREVRSRLECGIRDSTCDLEHLGRRPCSETWC